MANVTIEPPEKNIEGVKDEVATKVALMLQKGRRYFGSSGASLTHQVSNPDWRASHEGLKPELAKVGLDGERSTTRILKKWIEDKPNAVLIDSCHIRGWGKEEVIDEELGLVDGGDTDHVLIIGSEVILIDTKRWKSKRNYTVGDKGQVLRSGKEFGGGQVHMRQAIHMWLDYLHEDAALTGIVFINSEDTVVFRNRNWYTQPYRLVELERFEELLKEKWEKYIDDYEKTYINSTLVSQVVVTCVKPYDEFARVMSAEALKSFR